jgi:hypothetical protein
MNRYLCSLSGTCEPSRYGYESLEECKVQCQPSTEKELDYIVAGYALDSKEQVLRTAPSDRVEIIQRMTGVRVQLRDSIDVLTALVSELPSDVENSIRTFARYPALWDYMEELGNIVSYLTVKNALLSTGSPEALRWLQDHEYEMYYDDWVLYLTHSIDDSETREILFEIGRTQFKEFLEYGNTESNAPVLYTLKELSTWQSPLPIYKDWYAQLDVEYQTYRATHL